MYEWKDLNLARAERLEYALEQKGMTQAQLSEKTGISQATISKFKNGGGTPDVGVEKLIKIALALGVSLDYLVGISSTPWIEEDTTVVSETTGLSNKAVETLVNLQNVQTSTASAHDALQFFLEKGERGLALLSSIYSFLTADLSQVYVQDASGRRKQKFPVTDIDIPETVYSRNTFPLYMNLTALTEEDLEAARLQQITGIISDWRKDLRKEVEG